MEKKYKSFLSMYCLYDIVTLVVYDIVTLDEAYCWHAVSFFLKIQTLKSDFSTLILEISALKFAFSSLELEFWKK